MDFYQRNKEVLRMGAAGVTSSLPSVQGDCPKNAPEQKIGSVSLESVSWAVQQ